MATLDEEANEATRDRDEEHGHQVDGGVGRVPSPSG
jgi:hypothetical protein